MKIAIVDTLGLCYDGTTLTKRGLGGSESAVISIARELVGLGCRVTVFNDCTSDDTSPGLYEGVDYRPLHEVEDSTQTFDVVIGSRSVAAFACPTEKHQLRGGHLLPDFSHLQLTTAHKVLWMHDTFCDGDHLVERYVMEGRIDEIFTLSDFHTVYTTTCNHGQKRMFEVLKRHIWQTRNGINLYPTTGEKDPNLFVYNASVTKGLRPLLHKIWPRVKQQIPEAKLVVIGGYYRFRTGSEPDAQEVELHQLIDQYPDVTFTGVIKQSEVAQWMANASFMIYPPDFPETFGISSLEALAYGTPIITTNFGALEETAIDAACYKIPYSVTASNVYPHINERQQEDLFVEQVVQAWNVKYVQQQKRNAALKVRAVCEWSDVAIQWKQHLYQKLGLYLPVDQYRVADRINRETREIFGRRFLNPEERSVRKLPEKHIDVIVPVFNAETYIGNCIESIAAQDYDNYSVYIVNDRSTDGTMDAIFAALDSLPGDVQSKFVVCAQKENSGAVYNQWWMIQQYVGDDAIVMLVDGDDKLANDPTIFDRYNQMYHDGYQFTYGSCHSEADRIDLIAQDYPQHVKDQRTYRQHRFAWNMPYTHLRTFSSELARQITQHDLLVDGNWPKAGGDGALFYALIEKADPQRIKAVKDVHYIYNDLNPINDYKVNGEEQTQTAEKILAKGNRDMEKFTVVVPTMWRYEPFKNVIQQLIESYDVGEIIIINNDPGRTFPLPTNPKIKNITYGYNVGVNPAWNAGVAAASNNLVCILNDDLAFDVSVFSQVRSYLQMNNTGVIGICPGRPEYGQPPLTDGSIDIIPWDMSDPVHTFGFGCLMFVRKDSWTPIPEELKIYYGDYFIFDNYLYSGKRNYLITNINHSTPYASTCTTIGLDVEQTQAREGEAYATILEQIRNPLNIQLSETEQSREQGDPTALMSHAGPGTTPEPKRILIAIPTNKYIEPETFKSIYDLNVPQGYQTTFQFFYGYQIDQIRNLIAEWGKQFDYLFCVDSDIVLPNDALEKLLIADKDIISGVYRQRFVDRCDIELYKPNEHGGFDRIKWFDIRGEGLQEVGACGFGCVLIKSNVLKTMEYPHFVYKSALDHAHTFSEDVYFCKKAREAGFSVWCETTLVCGHVGKYNYELN